MAHRKGDEPEFPAVRKTDATREQEEAQAIAEYEPKGGDDLIPPAEDRPADGELGAGD